LRPNLLGCLQSRLSGLGVEPQLVCRRGDAFAGKTKAANGLPARCYGQPKIPGISQTAHVIIRIMLGYKALAASSCPHDGGVVRARYFPVVAPGICGLVPLAAGIEAAL
jgi:hypothetical protein